MDGNIIASSDVLVERADIRMQWFAVRVKHKRPGAVPTIRVGGEFETYRDKQGRVRKRRVSGTGARVFLPEHILRRAGFEVFLPVKKDLRRKNRFDPQRVVVTLPLLVDWLFVGWPAGEARWHELMDLDVVAGVMGTGGRPVEIPPARMVRLMRMWGNGMLSPECLRYMRAGAVYASGDVVRVPDGPFEGFDMTIIDANARSARGVIDIFGRETPIEVSMATMPGGNSVPDAPGGSEQTHGDDGDSALAACACGHRAAHVREGRGGFCVVCDNCGGRAAVGSASDSEARQRWNEWRSGVNKALIVVKGG